MKAVEVAKMYDESAKNDCISTYCASIFHKCCEDFFADRCDDVFEGDFFPFLFEKWLPYNICLEEKQLLAQLYPQAKNFCGYVDGICRRDSFSALKRTVCPKDTLRILFLKRELISFVNSPIISRNPLTVDFEKYKAKKERAEKCLVEKGCFQVVDIFGNNSVVLKKISGYTFFMRFYVNEAVIKLIRPKDVLDLVVIKNENLKSRTVYDVLGCFSGENYA